MLYRFLVAGVLIGLVSGTVQAEEKLRKGVNIPYLQNYPASDWPPFRGSRASISDRELVALKQTGFDHIRLPVDPTPYVGATKRRRDQLTSDLVSLVSRANEFGLSVIIASYTTDGALSWRPDRLVNRGGQDFGAYLGWLQELARTLGENGLGHNPIATMNEPEKGCSPARVALWSMYQGAIHAALRATTSAPIVLTGACWSRIEGLVALPDIPSDLNTYFDVHYYEPFAFTHQGASWLSSTERYIGGLRYPASKTKWEEVRRTTTNLIFERERTPTERQQLKISAFRIVSRYLDGNHDQRTIAKDFKALTAWAMKKGISPQRILIGEFGAFGTDVSSRHRYLRDVRTQAEAEGFGWAIWQYYPPSGLLSDEHLRSLDPFILRALGLRR